jgi:hypothetical protein
LPVVRHDPATEITYGGNGWRRMFTYCCSGQGTPHPVELARVIDRWDTASPDWTAKHVGPGRSPAAI